MAITKMNPTIGKIASKLHTGVYKMTGGKLGGKLGDAQAMVLGTTGRKSGKHRETPVFGVEHPNGWLIIASNSGHDKAPDWYFNLMAQPEATVQVGSDVHPVSARVLEGNERRGAWDQMVAVYKDYNAYQEVTDRVIPVLALDRTEG